MPNVALELEKQMKNEKQIRPKLPKGLKEKTVVIEGISEESFATQNLLWQKKRKNGKN